VNALEEARELTETLGKPLDELIDEALPDGVVYITATCVLIAERQPDAWFITLAVGKKCLHRLFALAPFDLPMVGWRQGRRGRMVASYYPTSRLKRFLSYE